MTLALAEPAATGGHLAKGLYIADASTGEIFKVETQPGPILYPRAWVSPTQLVTFALSESDNGLYLLDLNARTLRRLPVSPDDWAVSFSHSSGLMTSTGPAGELVISAIADNHEVARIANGPTSLPNQGPYIDWAPDDKHVFFRSASSPSGFIASIQAMPTVVAVETGCVWACMTWSPDGRAIVFANTDGIFSVDANSGDKTSLYAWPAGSNVVPNVVKLSLDEKFALVGQDVARDAYVVPLDGRKQGTRITNVEMFETDWLPRDDFLAVTADRCTADSRLLLVDVAGGARTTLVTGAIPRLSPDGSMLAYVGDDPHGGGNQAPAGLVIRSATGTHGLLSFVPYLFDDTMWSPDGRWLAQSNGDLPSPGANSCIQTAEKTTILPFP